MCECSVLHQEDVTYVQSVMIDGTTSSKLAEFFKVFGDPARLKILHALSQRALCVCDLSYLLAMSQSAVSHQLRLLRTAEVVRYRREGKVVFYELSDDHIKDIFDKGLEHINEIK